MAVLMSVTSRAGQVPMGTHLNRVEEVCTSVLAFEATPIVIPLKSYSSKIGWAHKGTWPPLEATDIKTAIPPQPASLWGQHAPGRRP